MRLPVSRLIVAASVFLFTACNLAEAERANDPKFPLAPHSLLPEYGPSNGQVATGPVQGLEAALDQPIGFSHKLHAGELGMDCQYCHSEARRSLHGGVPPLQTCMGCHTHVKTDSPQVQKIHQHWCGETNCTPERDAYGQMVAPDNAQPIAWNKVHDLPDYVHFAHNRHVQGGVDCTECHGQVQLQGEYRLKPMPGGDAGEHYRHVETVMVRETEMQMGWCLSCHENHPSIQDNYGPQADLRRAELKDCWTCHK